MRMPERTALHHDGVHSGIHPQRISNGITPVIRRQPQAPDETNDIDSRPTRDADELADHGPSSTIELVPEIDEAEDPQQDEPERVNAVPEDEAGLEEEEELIQPKRYASQSGALNVKVMQDIHDLSGAGQPLPASERAFSNRVSAGISAG